MGIFTKLKESLGSPEIDYAELIVNGAVIVDVRSKAEFETGHAPNSINMPLQSLGLELKSLKGKTVILVCRSGARAGQAKALLSSNKITAYNAGRWQKLS
ncbi:MAG: phage shock protein E [Parvicellaceae bacterium]|jgi:phage shock protein E